MLHRKRSERGQLIAIIATVITVALAALLFLNRQWAVDQLIVWQYQPTDAIKSIVDRSSMSDGGKFMFYASQPSISEAQNFNRVCGNASEEHTAILGCYVNQYIYIYNVTNEQLDGIKEVTAAHEMLHAAYERLGKSDKAKVDKWVEAEYKKLKQNDEFSKRVKFYERTEPGQRNNELHSIIGTEVANIEPGLEKYYQRYFKDRRQVVALYDKYSSVFTRLQERSEAIVSQMNNLTKSIESRTVQYNKDVDRLTHDITNFNDRAENGQFASQAQFNSERASLVARAAELDDRRQLINDDIARYETLRQELAKVASQSEALNKSIDSSLQPAPSI